MTLQGASAVLTILITMGPAVALGKEPVPIPGPPAVTIENCGVSTTYREPPRRVVTLNQAATELMLALGLQDRMIGTAYLDDAILPALSEAYKKVPVLARGYPSRDALLAAQPDFVFATYSSAFTADELGPREELGSIAYLSPSSCPGRRSEPVSIATLYREIREIGQIFDVASRAEELIATYEADLRSIQTRIGAITNAPTVFWYDAGSPPSAGACCGMPSELLRLVGAENVFSDTPGSWTGVSWDDVIEKDPDVIVLVDSPWSSAVDKAMRLNLDPALAQIEAVMQHRYVTIDFSSTTSGIRTIDAVRRLAEGLYPARFERETGPRPLARTSQTTTR